jgi:hypothetical protein
VLDPGACAARLRDLDGQGAVHCRPASHFWLVQLVESALFLGLAALLVLAAVLAVTGRPA